MRDGQWFDSQDGISILQDGSASATNGPSQAFFSADIGNGPITLISPEGIQIEEQPSVLCMDDGTNTFVLGVLTNSVGQIIGDNEVIYTNAFLGINGDILDIYRRGGLEQDVILEQRPPDPQSVGLNAQTSSLKILTAFASPVEPTITSVNLETSAGAVTDEDLQFGSIRIVPGNAFLLGTNQTRVCVTKSWIQMDGNDYLVESVPLAALDSGLSMLSASAAPQPSPRNLRQLLAAMRPDFRRSGKSRAKVSASRAALPAGGLDLDFVTITGGVTNYDFQSDSTYFISGSLTLLDTNIFEGGAVLKYTNGASITVLGDLFLNSGPFLPVIFTAMDDDTIGEQISGSTGNPTNYYANPALLIGASSGISGLGNFRVAYAQCAVNDAMESQFGLTNGEIVDCASGMEANGQEYLNLNLRNMLFANVETNLDLLGVGEPGVNAQNTTFAFSKNLLSENFLGESPVIFVNMANCIMAGVTNSGLPSSKISLYCEGSNNGFYSSFSGSLFGSDYVHVTTDPFQTIGAGDYYLTTNCEFRAAGTADIDPALLAELAQKTTWPPLLYTNQTITSNVVLLPAISRDTNSAPDLGFHYAPIDFITENYTVTNASLTINNGVVIACYNDTGIQLSDGSSITAVGTPLAPNWFTYYGLVQEQPVSLGTNIFYYSENITAYHYGSDAPTGIFEFCKFTVPGADNFYFQDDVHPVSGYTYGSLLIQDCEFWNGNNDFSGASSASVTLMNDLFARSHFYVDETGISGFRLAVTNNLFWGIVGGTGDVQIYNESANTFSFFNNEFDTCRIDVLGTITTNGNNAYLNCTDDGRLHPTNVNDIVESSSLAYETGPLGTFYQPPDSPLINHGNTNAGSLSLYWFTTQTNQAIEGNTIVDIGYHYVAMNANGAPLDTYNPPVANYISDPEGGTPPEIITNPVSQIVGQYSNATFNVTAVGTLPLSYQWYLNGEPLSDDGGILDSESVTLTLDAVEPDQAGYYYVVVTNAFGSAISSNATLTVEQPQTAFPYPPYLLSPSNYWSVTDISDPAQPVSIGELQAPFSESGYLGPPPVPFKTSWHTGAGIATNAFGTTEDGGANGEGTVFAIGVSGGLAAIHTFSGTNDGAYPCSQLAISGGTFWSISNFLYGTTSAGGRYGLGTVFEVSADGSLFTNLYDFSGANDGEFPQTGLLIDGNTLYGTTSNSIFKINTDGSDFACLTNIIGASQLILSASGYTLYGTTKNAGTYGGLFSVSTSGSSLTWLHYFTGGTNGAFPSSGLEILECSNVVLNGSTTDTLYGTTYSGGASNLGMVYRVDTDGSNFMDLHDFTGTADGANPAGGLLLTNNNPALPPSFQVSSFLYGTTSMGGSNNAGTLFGMSLDGSGFANLFNFGGTNGERPVGKLVLNGGTLLGTTSAGGTGTGTNGTVFSVNFDGTDFTNLYEFGGSDGSSPVAGLALPVVDDQRSIWSLDTTINVSEGMNCNYEIAVDDCCALFVNGNLATTFDPDAPAFWQTFSSLPFLHAGQNDIRVIIVGNGDENDYFAMAIRGYPQINLTLFGTTYNGGTNGEGAVFKIATSGEDTVLYSFSNSMDGENPIGDLVLSGTNLYGVTQAGGTNDAISDGTIFSISTNGSNYQILHSFDGTDGSVPFAGLLLVSNTLYGTTSQGGVNGLGTLFSLNTDGSDYSVLYNFGPGSQDAGNPEAPLIMVSNVLYGVASSGSSSGDNGGIFSYDIGTSNYQTLYFFGTDSYDGADWNITGTGPERQGGLIFCSNVLYGTCSRGGEENSFAGNGTVFSFTLGSTNDVILHAFTNSADGEHPEARLVLLGGTLYGTTFGGGTNNDGTLFSLGVDGSGYTSLLSFGAADSDNAENPWADLLIESNVIYGTTDNGGGHNAGVLFSVSTNGSNFIDVYDLMNDPDGANPQGGVSSP